MEFRRQSYPRSQMQDNKKPENNVYSIPEWSRLVSFNTRLQNRALRSSKFEPYYTAKYGVKHVLTNDGRYDYVENAHKWENFNGFDFCSKIVANCVEIQAHSHATVVPSDFQNCKKLIIQASGRWDSSYGSDKPEGYERDLELISNLNHPSIHLHVHFFAHWYSRP